MIRWLLALGLLAMVSCPACAQTIVVEAESFVAHHDEGGTAIYITSCSSASGGLAVEGFDTVGDWIEVVLNLPSNDSFADSLRSGGITGHQSDLRSTVYGAGLAGEDLVSSFGTLGMGIG